MSESTAQVTAAEISRLAGVSRATVSNWRRRHSDFPSPVGGSDASPTYDLEAVRAWLAERGQLPEPSPETDLRIALRGHVGSEGSSAFRLLPLVLPLNQLDNNVRVKLAGLSDDDMLAELAAVVGERVEGIAGIEAQTVASLPPTAVRALVRCLDVEDGGVEVALDVLAECLVGEAGEYATPRPLAELMVALLPAECDSVLDPACGTGGFLAEAGRIGVTTLFGQEVVTAQAALATVRAGTVAPDVEVVTGDSLRADAFPEVRVDGVLCDPPFGLRGWGHDELAYDPRWEFGLPPRAESELAWVQHCLSHLDERGRAVVLMPPGAAERAAGRRIRAELVRTGALRAVIALPQGTAPPLHLSLQLWVLEVPDSARPELPPVLFVDATSPHDTAGEKSRRGVDFSALSERIVAVWREFDSDPDDFEPVPAFATVRPVVDLLDEDVDLTPGRQVPVVTSMEPDRHDARVEALRTRLRRAGSALVTLSAGRLWETAGAEPTSWRTATVADLLRGGAVTLHRTGVAREPEAVPTLAPVRVLTYGDVQSGARPSATSHDKPLEKHITIETGDVILAEHVHFTGGIRARVAHDDDTSSVLGSHLFLLRPDPERLDSWFLAGFLSAEENIHGATVGSSVFRLDVRRLRVPLLPLDRQQAYGRAFRQAHAMTTAARLAARIAEETAAGWAQGLTSGALLPPENPA